VTANAGDDAVAFRVEFDARVHSEQALLRACYSLDHLCVFKIENQNDRRFVYCSPRRGVEGIEPLLRSAVIDFSVRESVEARTGDLRNLIWRTAFAEARGSDTK